MKRATEQLTGSRKTTKKKPKSDKLFSTKAERQEKVGLTAHLQGTF